MSPTSRSTGIHHRGLDIVDELKTKVLIYHRNFTNGFARHACEKIVFLCEGDDGIRGKCAELFGNPQTLQLKNFLGNCWNGTFNGTSNRSVIILFLSPESHGAYGFGGWTKSWTSEVLSAGTGVDKI